MATRRLTPTQPVSVLGGAWLLVVWALVAPIRCQLPPPQPPPPPPPPPQPHAVVPGPPSGVQSSGPALSMPKQASSSASGGLFGLSLPVAHGGQLPPVLAPPPPGADEGELSERNL